MGDRQVVSAGSTGLSSGTRLPPGMTAVSSRWAPTVLASRRIVESCALVPYVQPPSQPKIPPAS